MEEYIERYIEIANTFGTVQADNELVSVSVQDLTLEQKREVKQRALKLIDERELVANLGGQQIAPPLIGWIMAEQGDENRQFAMIRELIDRNANSRYKLNALRTDIENTKTLSDNVKERLYVSINRFTQMIDNAVALQPPPPAVLNIPPPDPLAPPTPQILSEYVEPQMRFTKSIINNGIENAMRYLPPF